MKQIHVIYENPGWMEPLRRELNRAAVPYTEIFLHTGSFGLQDKPKQGVYINRISPSSHTRDHAESIFFNREYLTWLESHGCRVINGSCAYALEISKVRQQSRLESFGIRTPKTIVVCGGSRELLEAAQGFTCPFITKHNCGGKGLGVKLFRSLDAFQKYVTGPEFESALDSITLLQEFIESPSRSITRVEIVGGQYLYAISSDTSQGFGLCPADTCGIGNTFCPAGDVEAPKVDHQTLFKRRENFDDPIIQKYIDFCAHEKIDIAGFEFVEDSSGTKYTYDINCTTNYSPGVEAAHGLNGMKAVVELALTASKSESSLKSI